jgi:RNA polymerase sigma factor (sigma-70 family)
MLMTPVLQRAFHLIRCIHPDRAVAICVLLDACERIVSTKNQQRRRHGYKVKTPKEGLLQVSVYSASEHWEKDQESECPKKQPNYQPTSDDRLVRYVKTLAWKSMDWQSHYGAVGLGCLLYRYQPHEVSGLAEDVFKSDNIRRVKGTMSKFLKERFEGPNGLVNGNGDLPFELPSNHQRALIQASLSQFAPWISCLSASIPPSVSLLETYFDKSSEKSEWERLHVLFDPICGGFARLVAEYNSTFERGNKMRLEDAENKLGSPKFGIDPTDPSENGGGAGPSSSTDRFNPSPLTPDEISVIRHALDKNERRRNNYHSSKLRIFVDGRETVTFNPDSSFEPFAIPDKSSHLEIFGEDEDGELLLAFFPLTCQGIACDSFTQQVSVTGGQRIEASIVPVSSSDVRLAETDSESAEKLVSLSYSDLSSGLKKSVINPAVGMGKVAILGVGGSGVMIADQYRLLEALGRGSISTVYKAQDLRNNKLAAVKIFCGDYQDNRLKLRFKQEIGKLAGIKHSGVVSILDFEGLSEKQPYMVMEYVTGPSLRHELRPQGMELDRIADFTSQITQALGAVHDQGILHRDIKPENILLHNVDGEVMVKICDFGIANVFEKDFLESKRFTAAHESGHLYTRGGRRNPSKSDTRLTVWGSPAYMAPELLMGEKASIQTDLYSLATILYEMITGQMPFVAESSAELFELKCSGIKAMPCDLRPDLPRTVQDMILKGLAVDPRDRYSSAIELGDSIARGLRDKTAATQSEKLSGKNTKSRGGEIWRDTKYGSTISAIAESTLQDLLREIALGKQSVEDLLVHSKVMVGLQRICRRVYASSFNSTHYSSEDLYQDVCHRLISSAEDLKPDNVSNESQLFGWLHIVTRNMVLDRIRRSKVRLRARMKSRPILDQSSSDSNLKLEDFHLLIEFNEFGRTLSEDRQKAIELWLAGYTYREISKELNTAGIQCSHVTVHNWITRALKDFNSNSLKATKPKKIRPP